MNFKIIWKETRCIHESGNYLSTLCLNIHKLSPLPNYTNKYSVKTTEFMIPFICWTVKDYHELCKREGLSIEFLLNNAWFRSPFYSTACLKNDNYNTMWLKIVISTRWNLMVILKCREKVFQYYLLGSLDVVKVNQASLRKHATS